MRFRFSSAILLAVFSLLEIIASDATLIADLNPGPTGSFPSNLTTTANFLLFSAYTLDTGRELFKTDGTNITLVADINDTKDDLGGGLLEGNDALPAWLTPFGGSVYFSAYEPRRGAELWKYDGSTVQRLTDINPDANDTIKFAPNNAWPSDLTVFNNAIYFSADNSAFRTNYELWKYDGVAATLITNIHPDIGADHGSFPNTLKVWNGSLYFMADNGSNGFELYKHDGTSTVLLHEINPGINSAFPKKFTPFKNELLFVAHRDDIGEELWKTDGTNVTLTADINSGLDSSYPNYLTEYNGALYFRATNALAGAELWKFDGTNATLAADINPTGDSWPKNLAVFRDKLVFAADDGANGWELWQYDGDSAQIITNLNSTGDAFPETLVILENTIYFSATTPETGYELWKYDGTNVTIAADINPGPSDSWPQFLFGLNGKLFFRAAADGINDWELWSYTPPPTSAPPEITLQIQSVEQIGADIRLRWTTAGGSLNIVQAASDLSGDFEDISPQLSAPGAGEVTLEYTDQAPLAPRFYRIKRL